MGFVVFASNTRDARLPELLVGLSIPKTGFIHCLREGGGDGGGELRQVSQK